MKNREYENERENKTKKTIMQKIKCVEQKSRCKRITKKRKKERKKKWMQAKRSEVVIC